MLAMMMDRPLTLPSILEYAACYHGEREIVTRTLEGPLHRYGYADALRRAKQAAQALLNLGVKPGDRVATLAWSTYRHFELYYAVAGVGAVLHTVNPRLHLDQLAWVMNQGGAKVLLFDATFTDLVEQVAPKLSYIVQFVLLADAEAAQAVAMSGVLAYETLLEGLEVSFSWPELDERQATALCYTSGTTGDPKGVLYGHRSTVLHALSVVAPDAFDLSQCDVVLPCAQMYHANAWGLPYAAPLVGAKLLLPGRQLDGASVADLAAGERASFMLGVPTIWLGVLDHLEQSGRRLELRTAMLGGSAPTLALVKRIEAQLGARVRQGWGMTETSPLGAFNSPLAKHEGEPANAAEALKLKQGRALWGVELRVVDADRRPLPHDGVTPGALQVRGPWVASRYFGGDGETAFTEDGWFDTGDVATLDSDGYLSLTDRAKDVIKSGGEWISSLALEEAVASHPAVSLAAAIGVHHPKWDERPHLLVMLKPGHHATPEELRDHVSARVAKWWVPDEVEIVEALPIGVTGKVLKRELRRRAR